VFRVRGFLAAAIVLIGITTGVDFPAAMAYDVRMARPASFHLVIHGGAGAIPKERRTPETEAEVRAALAESLRAGQAILARGGAALDAVEAAVRVLEDSPHFNAGKGAVFNSEGVNELDASIMDGATLKAGAVAAVKRIRNPVSLARLVMEKSPHVLLAGDGAEAFAREQGMEWVDPSYFHTDRRFKELQEAKEREKKRISGHLVEDEPHFGTVGAVALDQAGNLAAATSTGGLTNKRFGRVGDSPIVGAGNYADRTCAVSGTGKGEFFIRAVAAYDVCARVGYQRATLVEAADAVLAHIADLGGEGGLIAVDLQGNVAMPFNTAAMYRGHVGPSGALEVAIDR
jgi:beta-aspartyl-peptidase (threonine type)